MSSVTYPTSVCKLLPYISLGIIQSAPTQWVLAFFLGFMNFGPMRQKFVPLGGYVYIF